MKIAIATDNNSVSGHFGRCPQFTIIEVENNKVINRQTIDNPGHHPGFLPEFLGNQGVEAIVAGGMGPKACELFLQKGIKTILGINLSIDEAINKIVNNQLEGHQSSCKPGDGKGYGIPKTDSC
jgi:predicted Fe-Mo cluster-binding NifX family protein